MTKEPTQEEMDDMSAKEYGQYLDDLESGNTETKDADETIKPDEQSPEPEEKESGEPLEDSKSESTEESTDDEDIYTKGKSRSALIEQIKNGSVKVSQQGNENAQLKKENEFLRNQKQTISQKTDEDIYEKYEKSDIEVINRIVDSRLESERNRSEAEKKRNIDKTKASNESDWEFITKTQPDIAKKMQESLYAEVRKNPENTLQKPGWVSDYYSFWTKNNKSNEVQKDRIIKKTIDTTTVSGGGGQMTQGAPSNKSTDDMTSSEYAKHCHDNGVMI